MGFIATIKSVFGGTEGSSQGYRVCIVDAEKFADPRDGRVGPPERFRAIQQLARFREREQLEIIAIVGGRPLREVADGETYNGVRVYYVEENKTIADQIEKALASAGARKSLVITNDRQLEARMRERGVATMRITTFKRGVESSEASAAEEGSPKMDRDRERRPRRSIRAERPPEEQAAAPTAPAAPEDRKAEPASNPAESTAKAPPAKPQDTIDGLIDRVS